MMFKKGFGYFQNLKVVLFGKENEDVFQIEENIFNFIVCVLYM